MQKRLKNVYAKNVNRKGSIKKQKTNCLYNFNSHKKSFLLISVFGSQPFNHGFSG